MVDVKANIVCRIAYEMQVLALESYQQRFNAFWKFINIDRISASNFIAWNFKSCQLETSNF